MKASRSISLETIGARLSRAKTQLSLEKKAILKGDRLPEGYSREEYAFAYLRAERNGMQAINTRLAEIAWLPMQLDPQSELVSENRTALKRWLAGAGSDDPGSNEFGNDFIHALTRSCVCHGWDAPITKKLATRIANLFRDLSCLIGMVYFTGWLSEREVEGIALSDPDDLYHSVIETAAIVQSPELQQALEVRENETRKTRAKKALAKPAGASVRPFLRLIRNDAVDGGAFMPDPLPV